MRYNELLSQYIDNSSLSLGEISLRLAKKNIDISRSYISKLKNGVKPPASEEISRALAEITGGDPEQLIMAGYIEKAPEEIQELLNGMDDPNELLKRAFTLILNDNKEAFLSTLKKESEDEDEQQELPQLVDNDFFTELFDRLSTENKLQSLITLLNYGKENNVSLEEILASRGIIQKAKNDNLEKMTVGNRIMLPIIGTIKAGPYGLDYKEPLGEAPIDEESLNGGKYFWLKIKDDSMIGDGILPGDLVLVREQPKIESGELAVVIVDEEEGSLKRIFIKDGSIVLQSSNPSYPPRIFTGIECESVRIVGKVKEVKRKY